MPEIIPEYDMKFKPSETAKANRRAFIELHMVLYWKPMNMSKRDRDDYQKAFKKWVPFLPVRQKVLS